METKELDNLNRDELFKELKGKCKSVVKRNLYSFIAWILVILLLIFTWQTPDDSKKIFYFIFWPVLFCFVGWSLLFDLRFLKIVDNLDTPDRLLHWFEKRHRYNYILWLVAGILISVSYLVESGFNFGATVGVVLGIGIIAFLFYSTDGPWWYRKEKDIIERLREFVEKK